MNLRGFTNHRQLLRLVMFFVIQMTTAQFITATTYSLTQVTTVSAGNKYVFVRNSKALIGSVSSNAIQTTSSYNTTSLTGSENYVWLLETATNGFYIKNCKLAANQYINNTSSTNISLGSKSSIWKFDFTDGKALISNTSNSNRFLGETTSNSDVYKAYATGNLASYGHDFTVYRLDEEVSCTPVNPTVTYSATTLYKDETASVSSITGNTGSAAVTYSSSDATIASVNESTGVVTALKAGSATITAAFAASGEYCAKNVSIDFTVRYEVKWSVNGNDGYSAGSPTSYIGTHNTKVTVIPDAPTSGDCDGNKQFVGWTTSAYSHASTPPATLFTTQAASPAITDNTTFYAVFATAALGDPVETKTQTLQYDTWSYSGSTTDKTSYRLFHNGSYITSAAFDLSKLSKVVVKGGTFGGDSYNSLTISDGTNTWKNVTVSGKSETGTNTYTGGTALSGTKALRITSNSGTASGTGVRISKVEIYTMEPAATYSDYATTCCTRLGAIGGTISWITPEKAHLTWNNMPNVAAVTPYTVTCIQKSSGIAAGSVGTIALNSSTGKDTCSITSLTAGVEYTFSLEVTAAANYCDKDTTFDIYAPLITLSAASLSGMAYAEGSGPSNQDKSFSVSGVGLTGDITVSAPTNFEVSKTGASTGFSSSVTLTPVSGTLSSSNVWVRLAEGLSEGSYGSASTYVTVSGGSAATQNISVQGTVSNACHDPEITGQPSGDASYNLNESAAALSITAVKGNIADPALTYQWYSNTVNSTVNGSAIPSATGTAYTPPTNTTGTRYYYCIVSSGACSETSDIADVTVNTPTISADETDISFGDRGNGGEYELTLTVSGSHLAEDDGLTLAVTGTDAALFAIDKTSISAVSNTVGSTTVTVTYSPNSTGSHSATLTISSTGAESININLTGTSKWNVTWKTGDLTHSATLATDGDKPVLPSAPAGTALGACGNTFIGWTTDTYNDNTPHTKDYFATLFTTAAAAPSIDDDITFYAVFADREDTPLRPEGYYVVSGGAALTVGNKYVFGAVKAAASASLADNTAFGAVSFTNTYNTTSPNWGSRVDITPDASGYFGTGSPLTAACVWTLQSITSGNHDFTNSSGNHLYLGNKAGNTTNGAQAGINSTNGNCYMETYNESCKNAYRLYGISDSPDYMMLYNTGSGYRMYSTSQTLSASMTPYVRFYMYHPGYNLVDYRTQCDDTKVLVTYDADGGTTSCSRTWITKGADFDICSSEPTRDYYTFLHWTDANDNTYDAGATIDGEDIDDNIALTAVWEPVTYTITYNLDGGTNNIGNPADYNIESSDINLLTPVREHYEFMGWTDDDDSDADITAIAAGSHRDYNLTAHWREQYSVTWKVQGQDDNIVWFNQNAALVLPDEPATPSACGSKVFVGWTSDTPWDGESGKPEILFNSASGNVTDNVTYYAVFADEEEGEVTKTLNFETASNSDWTVDAAITRTASEGVNSSYAGKINTANTYITFKDKVKVTEFSFRLKRTSDNNNHNCYIETSGNGSDWSAAATFAMSGFANGSYNTASSKTWDGNTAYYVRFHCHNTTATRYVDEVRIKYDGKVYSNYAVNCCSQQIAAPVVTDTKTAYTVTLTWADITSANGNATAYEMQWDDGEWTTVTSPVNKTSLSPNTAHTWKVRVKTWTGDYYCGALTASGTTTTNTVYSVTYNKNTSVGSGTVNMTPMPSDENLYETGDAVTAAAQPATATNAGYTFNGWNTAADGSGTHVDAEGTIVMETSDLTLYAEWQPKQDTYIDDMHNNDIPLATTSGYYTVPTLSDEETASTGICSVRHYKFIGWVAKTNINSDGTLKGGATIITGGGNKAAGGNEYHAVWAEETAE